MSEQPDHGPLSPLDVLAEEYAVLRDTAAPAPASEAELFNRIHAQEQPLAALCISGGGIRSATFALGAVQGLAEKNLLGKFDYLSTVSGGGYIGAWLTSWKQRRGGLDRVIPFLGRKAAPIAPGEPDPIQHLREYNSYLSPKVGLFSTDSWTLAATVARNMLLNWLVFVPLLVAALLAPRLAVSLARLGETVPDFYPLLGAALENVLPVGIPLASGFFFALAVFNILRYLPSVGRAQHTELDYLRWVVGPLILAALLFTANQSWLPGEEYSAASEPHALSYRSAVGGVTISALAGWLAYLLVCGKKLGERIRLFLTVTLAVILAGVSAGFASGYIANSIYRQTSWPVYVTVSPPLLVSAMLLAGCLFVGLTSRTLRDEDREWLSRAAAWALLFVAVWTAICGIVLLGPDWARRLPGWGKSILAFSGVAGGWLTALGGASTKTSPTREAPSLTPLMIRLGVALAAPVFVLALGIGLSAATDWLLVVSNLGATCPNCAWWEHRAVLERTHWESIALLAAALLLFGWMMARYININKFSLHAMYRNRLIRAYLGASNDRRNASQFTGFAENDNVYMRDLTPGLKPYPIVNVTLNLVAGQRLAWQQRKAESFTISPLHCGSSALGYRPAAEYGGPEGISLGTAITISGAAASPNMGYHSSPAIGFIMTLFNARLGSWLGNPGAAGRRTWRQPGPTSAVGSLVREAFGLTDDTSRYVYLSDGGHFENLALYEMVRRRCRYIVVLDGGCDPDFTYGDLGNALRKIRIDLKIAIEFEEGAFGPLREKGKRCAVARIGYSAVDDTKEDGRLLYIKPMVRGNEPPDVLSYQSDNLDFPHQSTADQCFDESQTESYRALGLHTLLEVCEGWDGAGGLGGLIAHVSRREAGGAQAAAASAGKQAGG